MLHVGYADDLPSSQTTIEALAKQYDYAVVRFVSIDHDTFMPTTYIIDAAAEARAVVIIAADLEHFGTAHKAVPPSLPGTTAHRTHPRTHRLQHPRYTRPRVSPTGRRSDRLIA